VEVEAVKKLDVAAAALVVVGGVNWGLVSVANLDLVATAFGLRFGERSAATRAVYGLVGLSALYQIAQLAASSRLPNRDADIRTA
jgi:uncharacterized protein